MTRWLRCHVGDGMFRNERAIIVRFRGNGSFEAFVPVEVVEGEGEQGRVAVDVFTREDGRWAVLPTPYRKTLPIDEEQLVPT